MPLVIPSLKDVEQPKITIGNLKEIPSSGGDVPKVKGTGRLSKISENLSKVKSPLSNGSVLTTAEEQLKLRDTTVDKFWNKAESIKSLGDLMDYFREIGPHIESDFIVTIESPSITSSKFCLVNFSLPELGPVLSPDTRYLTAVTGQVGVGSVNLSYVIPYTEVGSDVITSLYNAQFTNAGTLQFIPASNLPKVTINYMTTSLVPFVTLFGCRFNLPLPHPNLAGNDKTVFSVNVSYSSYTIYPV